MSKTNSIRLASVILALLLGPLGHERRAAAATDLLNNTIFTNFTLVNEGVVSTTGSIIDYPNRLAPNRRKASYMVPVGFNAQRVTGKKFGLVVVLHGGGGNGAAFATDFYTNLIGSGYAFVFPWAATWPAGGTHFQTVGTGGTNCDGGPLPRSNANVTGTDCLEDVKFVQYMIDGIVKSNPQIDASKIFVVGHSNGAGLAFTMVCWGSKFKVNGVSYAIAGFAMSGKALGGVKQELWCGNSNANPASFPKAFSDPAVGFTGIPTRYGLDYGSHVVPLAFHFGLADDTVFCQPNGNCPDDPMSDPAVDDATETSSFFRMRHGLGAGFTQTSISDTDPDGIWAEHIWSFKTTLGLLAGWAPAAGSETMIKGYRITNGGHTPSSMLGTVADQCQDFDWSQEVINFFTSEAGLVAGPY